MDLWKFFAIGHADHVLCNPTSEAKIDELVELLALPTDARILDIACGKAEFTFRSVKRWMCEAVGVDISPYCIADANARFAEAGFDSSAEFIEANGADYDGKPGSFDASVCLGASWIWGGFEGTLRALGEWAKPGGLVIVGEPYWRQEPSASYLEAAGLAADMFSSHPGNVEIGLGLGFEFLYSIASSEDDWDRYEGLQTNAAERFARDNPNDPDVSEVLARIRKARDAYLSGGRAELGWAIYLFLKGSKTGADAPS